MELTTFFFAVLFTSVAAGGVGAILCLGGGILLVPILTMFYGVDIHYAMGASIISIIATSSGAASAYLKTGLSNVRIGLFLVTATTVGAILGAHLTGIVPVRGIEFILALALTYSAITIFQQLKFELPEHVPDDRWARQFSLEGEYYDVPLGRKVEYRATNVGHGFTAMFGAGILA